MEPAAASASDAATGDRLDAERVSSPSSDQPRASRPRPGRRHGPRTCRICLDTEHPKYPEGATAASRLFSSSRPEYESDDPELGRLLSPCKCKGSQKYVHEGCLNSWRLANPAEQRNYWQCPTCGFSYKMARLSWAAMLTSELAQASLTIVVFVISIFFLGFLADPVINLWLDPVGTLADTVSTVAADLDALPVAADLDDPVTWRDHFLKGFLSLGLVGLVKSGVTLFPWSLNRHLTGGRRQGTGRARVENIHVVFILIGVVTALVGIWKAVKRVSQSFLKNVIASILLFLVKSTSLRAYSNTLPLP
ncbi:E3 ubiquitin-protein ligase MARCH4 [Escovopsis weberi]|uniref:E3 ubiquitin-protein ligase MARCH4 n=1 Tax=Escovopsis weberi TaxID=150374 RepID=A0A0N0RTD3_ESCWE|nr:E3 ubiquitin-protein ligase MARCH4 [Escovopsis weberi]